MMAEKRMDRKTHIYVYIYMISSVEILFTVITQCTLHTYYIPIFHKELLCIKSDFERVLN
jgi:hypothetical protein